jgi:hypothetical protein
MNEILLVLFLIALDVLFPHVYRLFRLDASSAEYNFFDIQKNYRIVSFPRTLFWAVIIGLVIFPPKNMANNALALSGLVMAFLLYVIFAVVDSNRALAPH